MKFSERIKQAESLLKMQGYLSKYELAAKQEISPTYAEMILKTLAERLEGEVEWGGECLWLKDVLTAEEESFAESPEKLKQSTLDERAFYIDN